MAKTSARHLCLLLVSITIQGFEVPAGALVAIQQAVVGFGTYTALLVAADRPRGGCQIKGVEVRDSTVAGKGLFATKAMPTGTILGMYPGVCTPLEPHLDKLRTFPKCEIYIWRFSDSKFVVDPTNQVGDLEDHAYGGNYRTKWLFETFLKFLAKDTKLCRINEPPLGQTTNVRMEEYLKDRTVVISLVRDVSAGEELFADYGPTYDRSGYQTIGPQR